MFERLLGAARNLSDADSPSDVPASLSEAVPDTISVLQLQRLVSEIQSKENASTILWAVYATLPTAKVVHDESSEAENQEALQDVCLRIGELMEPACTGASFDEDSTNYTTLSKNGQLSLQSLDKLKAISSTEALIFPSKTVLSIIAYTNPADKWTTATSAELAQSLLARHFQEEEEEEGEGTVQAKRKTDQKARFITEDVLVGFLRPLFAKSRPTAITASGRPAAFPEPAPRYSQGGGFGGIDDVTPTKPWKFARQYAVTVFEWAVENADGPLLQQHWPLYTPVLLTLLDEAQPTAFKLRALSIFRAFWSRCPDGLLSRTGLTEVFEQAIFPTVLSLPSLTPPEESLALLSAAYPALFDMVGIEVDASRGQPGKASGDGQERQASQFLGAERKLLDKIVREGIMTGYHHAKEHIRLADFFCRTSIHLVDGIGILSIKYLKDIFLVVTEVLVDPFGPNYPAALLSATYLLQAVLRNCWPRIPHYCNEVIRIVMLCWLHIEDEDSASVGPSTRAALQTELRKAVEILSAITKASGEDMTDRLEPLVAKESSLRKLFHEI